MVVTGFCSGDGMKGDDRDCGGSWFLQRRWQALTMVVHDRDKDDGYGDVHCGNYGFDYDFGGSHWPRVMEDDSDYGGCDCSRSLPLNLQNDGARSGLVSTSAICSVVGPDCKPSAQLRDYHRRLSVDVYRAVVVCREGSESIGPP
ncbi:hypothetical protein PIB30_020647 [Stylosanthes scabra]|uniref:Uncharacterized protein n=1 Tax=Stylosanthes scabra TaxID=79078 RepID=A0ABU6U7P4_9FABA|nr:hypothetical protein [Stylosanthes scabra]